MTKTATATAPTADDALDRLDVPAAEQALAEAEQAEAELAERVRNLDPQVSADDLDEARRATGWRRLLLDGARRKAEKAAAKRAEQERAEQVAAARKLVEQDAQRAPIADRAERLLADVAELVAAVDRHDAAIAAAARMLRAAGCGPTHEYEQVHRDGTTYREPRPATATATAPRVDDRADAFTFGDGTRSPIGAGRLLAALFARAAAGVPAPVGEQPLDRLLAAHAARHGATLDALLAAATKNGK